MININNEQILEKLTWSIITPSKTISDKVIIYGLQFSQIVLFGD